MKLSNRVKLNKYLVYAYVILLAITGVLQLLVASTLLYFHISYDELVKNQFWGPALTFLCLSPGSFFLCWLGWSATGRKNTCKLGCFSALLVILILTQLFICGWGLTLREEMPDAAKVHLDESFESFLPVVMKSDRSSVWVRVQTDLKCCGVDGPSDYRNGAAAIPWACCSNSGGPNESVCATVYQRGCLSALSLLVRSLLLYLSLGALVLALTQSVGLFCAIQLIILLRRQDDGELDSIPSSELHPIKKDQRERTLSL